MTTTRIRPLLSLSGMAMLCLLASCSTKFPITFHLQGDETDSNKVSFNQTVGNKVYKFQKAAIIGNRDLENYTSLPDSTTGTYGAYFKLTPGAKNRWQAISTEHIGKIVIPMANGHPCEPFRIDHIYDKGNIGFLSGMTNDDMNKLKEVIDPSPLEEKNMKFNKAREKAKIDKLR